MKHLFTLTVFCSLLIGSHAATTNNAVKISQQEVIEAALYGKDATVKKALEEGYDVNSRDQENRTVLMYAAFNGQTNIINILLTAKADVNAQDKIGTSALMFAASGPGTEAVKILLKNGAKINMVDKNEHFSALMWAAAEGQAANVELLLKNGADLTLQDIDGDTAESFAAKAGHYAVVRILKAATAKKTEPKEEAKSTRLTAPKIAYIYG